MVDRGGADAADFAACAVAVDDSAGTAAGGVSLSATSVGDADGTLESGVNGAGIDDDLVPDAASAAGG